MSKVWRMVAWLCVIFGVLTGALRAVALRWWQVPADDPELDASVGPSLRGGDWVLLWRMTRPGLGDLVLCPDPSDPANVVIGRLAAESGDVVEIHGQKVLINGKAPQNEYNCSETFTFVDPDTLEETELSCEMEDLGGKLHMRGFSGSGKGYARKFKKKVEPGSIFLLSDNRATPFDSRHFGTVDRRSCQESIFFRLVSKAGFFDSESRNTYIR